MARRRNRGHDRRVGVHASRPIHDPEVVARFEPEGQRLLGQRPHVREQVLHDLDTLDD